MRSAQAWTAAPHFKSSSHYAISHTCSVPPSVLLFFSLRRRCLTCLMTSWCWLKVCCCPAPLLTPPPHPPPGPAPPRCATAALCSAVSCCAVQPTAVLCCALLCCTLLYPVEPCCMPPAAPHLWPALDIWMPNCNAVLELTSEGCIRSHVGLVIAIWEQGARCTMILGSKWSAIWAT